MRDRVTAVVQSAVDGLQAGGDLPPGAIEVVLDRPKRADHGDYSTNVALALAKSAKKSPRDVAALIAARLGGEPLLSGVDIAGPGFLNLKVSDALWGEALRDLASGADAFYRPDVGGGQRINVEFVSVNPTGPLHVGHGRSAVIGDVLVRLLGRTGFAADSEYYVNDRGNQVRVLGETLAYRYREVLGLPAQEPTDPNWYRGEYMKGLAQKLVARDGRSHVDRADSDPYFRDHAIDEILGWIREDLRALHIEMKIWTSERALPNVDETLAALGERGLVGTLEDGAKVFKTTTFGDDKDRVLVKKGGELTYLATDIPYHVDKFRRGYDVLIDLWGADHHGGIAPRKWALQALGHDPGKLEVMLFQMVSVLRGGETVVQSKRSGDFVTMREIVDEVGVGAARYFFLLRRADSQLEFDVDLAKKKSLDNPVFYAQYAHARCSSILERALEIDARPAAWSPAIAARLAGGEEWAVLKILAGYPDLLADAARAREPHKLVYFVQEVAQAFQSYYTRLGRTLDDPILPKKSTRVGDWRVAWDWERTGARLLWVSAVRHVLSDALGLLGVDAPDRMDRALGDEEASE